jgi:hypothetical protein
MPNKIEKDAEGNITVELETGEKFSGDPLAVTQKMAEAHVSTKRWGAEWKAKAETPPVQPPPVATPPPVDANQAQLRQYLLNEHAQALGYKSADEYKADLAKVKGTSEKVNNNLIVTEFFNLAPDFPNTPEASDAIAKKLDEQHWDFTPQSMFAAHAMLTREHAVDPTKGYAPLTSEQINATWANNMAADNRRNAPPMLRGNGVDSNPPQNPYAVSMDQLRKDAIAQELARK